MVDPSCSGSGIVSRLDHLLVQEADSSNSEREKQNEKERLQYLSQFQLDVVLHAMKCKYLYLYLFYIYLYIPYNQFKSYHRLVVPNLKRLVYSTCSIHQEENEQVVKNILARNGKQFQLVHLFPEWKRRGELIPGLNEGKSINQPINQSIKQTNNSLS